MNSPYTTLGLPPDGVAWTALAVASALVPLLHPRARRALSPRLLVQFVAPALAIGAALLSVGYVSYYLRGGPRIIDATSYYLQARAIAHGYFVLPDHVVARHHLEPARFQPADQLLAELPVHRLERPLEVVAAVAEIEDADASLARLKVGQHIGS